MQKLKYLYLGMNMLQTLLFVDYDSVLFYFGFQITLVAFCKIKRIMEVNLCSMFTYSIFLYMFCLFYALRFVTYFPSFIIPLFVTFFTNFVFSVTFLEMEAEEVFEEGECSICLEEGILLQLKECKHSFHPGCIQRWLHRQNKCPLCRISIK